MHFLFKLIHALRGQYTHKYIRLKHRLLLFRQCNIPVSHTGSVKDTQTTKRAEDDQKNRKVRRLFSWVFLDTVDVLCLCSYPVVNLTY